MFQVIKMPKFCSQRHRRRKPDSLWGYFPAAVPPGSDRHLRRAPGPANPTSARYSGLSPDSGANVCGVLHQDAGELLQLCFLVCCDPEPDGPKPQWNICAAEYTQELVWELSAETTAESLLLEIMIVLSACFCYIMSCYVFIVIFPFCVLRTQLLYCFSSCYIFECVNLRFTHKFKYLGTWVTSDETFITEIKKGLGHAKAAFYKTEQCLQ